MARRSIVQSVRRFLTSCFCSNKRGLIRCYDILVFFIIIGIVLGLFCKRFQASSTQPIDEHTQLLVADTSIGLRGRAVTEHNSALLNLLQEREAADKNQLAMKEGILWQARMFYSVILVGLASLLFTLRSEKQDSAGWVSFILLALIIFTSSVEVQLEDLRKRQESFYHITVNAIDSLVDVKSIDETWYKLDYQDYYKQLPKPSEQPSRYYRKLQEAVHPDVVQIIYYFVPWLAVYLFATRRFRKNQLPGGQPFEES